MPARPARSRCAESAEALAHDAARPARPRPLASRCTAATPSARSRILREQRALGWETLPPDQPQARGAERARGDGRRLALLSHASAAGAAAALPGLGEMRADAPAASSASHEVARKLQPAHHPRPLAGAQRAAGAARRPQRCGIPVGLRGARLLGGRRGRPRHHDAKAACATALTRRWRPARAEAAPTHVTTICEGLRGDIVARGIPASQGHGDPERGRHRRASASAARPTRR
ncbi:MAG: hypothetical protein MZW92_21320 [Comamonadaceae bacterium]|nr:hypothetical protein [Comamonadaceae bacterium]